jgi:hypothetical protein
MPSMRFILFGVFTAVEAGVIECVGFFHFDARSVSWH